MEEEREQASNIFAAMIAIYVFFADIDRILIHSTYPSGPSSADAANC
jgi:hypothetical protein